MSVYVNKDGQQFGPYTVEQLRMYVQQGNFTTADHACFDGQNWVTIAQVPGFAAGGDSVTTPQQPQAVPEDALESLPKKKKIILYASVGAIAALLVTGLLIWLLAADESNQTTAETPPVKSPEVAKVVVDGDKIEERDDLYYFEGKLFTGFAVDKYENGQKKYEATLKDGKEHGLYTQWYENGQKSWEGTFKDGEEISTKEWDEDGNPLGQDQGGEAPKSVVDATKVVVDADHLEERDDLFYFKGEPFTGCAVAEADNGQRETTYKDGKKHGLDFWYEDGQKSSETTYKDGKKHGLSTSWYENGQKSFEKTYKDGKMFSYKEWDEDGTPLGQDQEVGATKPVVEAAKVVVDDGKLEVRGGFYYFKGALFTGVTVAKGPNGKKSSETTFKDGNIDGLVTEWDENGQKKSEFIYSKDGKRNGLETQWYDNGQKEFEVTYKDEQEDGPWTFWYENGQMAEEGTSKDGNLVTAIAWKPNGEKCPDTNIVNGTGITCYYHDNGQKRSEHTYKDGKEDGLSTSWYENGQKSWEGTFKDGEEISFKSWDEDGNPK